MINHCPTGQLLFFNGYRTLQSTNGSLVGSVAWHARILDGSLWEPMQTHLQIDSAFPQLSVSLERRTITYKRGSASLWSHGHHFIWPSSSTVSSSKTLVASSCWILSADASLSDWFWQLPGQLISSWKVVFGQWRKPYGTDSSWIFAVEPTATCCTTGLRPAGFTAATLFFHVFPDCSYFGARLRVRSAEGTCFRTAISWRKTLSAKSRSVLAKCATARDCPSFKLWNILMLDHVGPQIAAESLWTGWFMMVLWIIE